MFWLANHCKFGQNISGYRLSTVSTKKWIGCYKNSSEQSLHCTFNCYTKIKIKNFPYQLKEKYPEIFAKEESEKRLYFALRVAFHAHTSRRYRHRQRQLRDMRDTVTPSTTPSATPSATPRITRSRASIVRPASESIIRVKVTTLFHFVDIKI